MTVHRIPAGRPTLSAMKWVALVWFLLCVGCCVRIFLQPLKGSVYSNYSQAGRAWVIDHHAVAVVVAGTSSLPAKRRSASRLRY